ncbi:hypothetical protein Ntsu_02970 [Nocardia sp. IFM 10818]
MVGQEHVTDPLSTALDTGRISHAYLFSGPRGCGKTSSARILARSLNCVEGPTSTPCGVCPSCVALGPGGSGNLDVIELDAASHGGVDDTRELRDRAFYAPAESRYRVFIVDEAHMVTTAGFNALLKIVEEPPAHLIFVFATTEPDKVLPTIRSRTHHYPFRLLPPATMRGLLGRICDQENVQVEESVYPLVIRAGGGSPRDSLSVLDQLLAGAGPEGVTYPRAVALLGVTDVALIDNAVEALAASDGAALFSAIDHVVEAGHDPRRFATDLLERLRDLILLRAVPDAADRNLVTGPGDVLDRMRDQATRIGPATLARYAELLHEGLGDMRGATAPRLLLEVIAARMLLPAVSDAETATLQRLEILERRVASGPIPAAASSSAPAAAPAAPAAPQAPTSGEPRRRGAEALAALRESRSGGKVAAPNTSAPVQPSQSVPGPAAAAGNPDRSGQAPTPQASAPAQQPQTSAATGGSAHSTAEATAAMAQGDSPEPSRPATVRPPEMNAVGAVPAEAAPVPSARAGEDAAPHRAAAPAPSAAAPSTAAAGAQIGTTSAEGASAVSPNAPAPANEGTEPQQVSQSASGSLPSQPGGAANTPAHEAASAPTPAAAAPAAEARSAGGQSASESAAVAPDRMAFSAQAGATPAHAGNAAGSAPAAGTTSPASEPSVAGAAERQSAVAPGTTASTAGAGAPATSAQEHAEVAPEPAVQEAPTSAGDAEGSGGASADAVTSAEMAELSGADVLREIEGAWADIRAKVREFGSAAVQALLSGGTVLRVEGETIVFGHQHAPLAQRLSQPANLDAVRSAVRVVLGREHDIKWEVGGSGPAAAGRGAGTGPGAGKGAPKKEAPRFSRPSQAKAAAGAAGAAAAPAKAGGWGTPTAGGVDSDSAGAGRGAAGAAAAPPEDDIPLPDGPDLPDDPGPGDYSSVGYDGVPPATTEEEERELLADAARPVPAEERRDPDEVALELLRSELGATPLEG